MHLETDEYLWGPDPLGLLAATFPHLQVLKAPRMYSSKSLQLGRFPNLRTRKCRLPRDGRGQPFASFEILLSGRVSLFISVDEDFRGQGISWAELECLDECLFSWNVGRGVSREQIVAFMKECGVVHQTRVAEDQMADDAWFNGSEASDVETDT